jgi:hypothetical protein
MKSLPREDISREIGHALLLTDNLITTEPYARDLNSQWKIVDTECHLTLVSMSPNSKATG